MSCFPWVQQLNINNGTNWHVKMFTDLYLNIMPNFIPSETRRFVPRDPTWITKPLIKNRLCKNYKIHGHKEEDKVRFQAFRIECQKALETATLSYLPYLGNKVNKSATSQKSYWNIINRVMNSYRAAKITPLFINNQHIVDCKKSTVL